MKKIISILTGAILLISCQNSTKINQSADYNKGRIKFTESTNNGITVLYIVKVDSSEFLVSRDGGISKIK